jgi:hypothetical protein
MNSIRLIEWVTAASSGDGLVNNDLAPVVSPVDEPPPSTDDLSPSADSVFTLSIPMCRDELDEDQGRRAFDLGIDTLTALAMQGNPPSPKHVVVSYEDDIGMVWQGDGECMIHQSHHTKKTHLASQRRR